MKFLLLTYLSTGLVAGRLPNVFLAERDLSLDVTVRTDDITPRILPIVRQFDAEQRHFKRTADLPTPAAKPSPHLIARVEPVATATTTIFPNDPAPAGTEWDQSFVDSGKRSIVKNAWAEAQRLAELAAQGLTDLAKEYPRSAENDTAARNSIARTSPAMAQVFGSEIGRINDIQSIFQLMVDAIPNINHGARNGVVVRLALADNVRTVVGQKKGGQKRVGQKKLCSTIKRPVPVYAATYNPAQPGFPTDLQKKYRFADAIIFFCPEFFSLLEDDSTLISQSPMLDRLRTRGQTVLHEWTHLKWIANANPDLQKYPEIYGFQEVAQLYKDRGWAGASQNADSYAVFASYNAYNQEEYAPSDEREGFGCKDVWPRGSSNADFSPAKPVKDSFSENTPVKF